MPRVTDIVGKPVVAAETGVALGRVEEVVLDSQCVRIHALVVGVDWRSYLGDGCVLPFSRVRAVGADVIVAEGTEELPRVAEWRNTTEELGISSDALKGRAVITATGERVGAVEDVTVTSDGSVEAICLAGGSRDGGASMTVPMGPSVRVGQDAVVVSGPAAPAAEGQS